MCVNYQSKQRIFGGFVLGRRLLRVYPKSRRSVTRDREIRTIVRTRDLWGEFPVLTTRVYEVRDARIQIGSCLTGHKLKRGRGD